MPNIKNISTGARGAYLNGAYVEAAPGETIEADDFCKEWFEVEKEKPATKAKPPAKDADKDA